MLDDPLNKIIKPFMSFFDWLVERPHINVLLWFALSIILFGVGTYPDYFILSRNPFSINPEGSIYQDSILLPCISFILGLNRNFLYFIIFCFVILFLSFIIYTYRPIPTYGKIGGAISLFLLVFHPMIPIQFNGLGLVDGLTILMSGLLIYLGSPLLLLLISILGVLNHPIFLVIGPCIAILRITMKTDGYNLFQLISIIAGCIIGYFFVRLFLSVNNLDIPINRLDFMAPFEVFFEHSVALDS